MPLGVNGLWTGATRFQALRRPGAGAGAKNGSQRHRIVTICYQ